MKVLNWRGGLALCWILASSQPLHAAAAASWSGTGTLNGGRTGHVVVLLNDGRLLGIGGNDGSGSVATVERYDPATGRWTLVAPLGAAREAHTATLLPSGEVLVAGGRSSGSPISSAELYDPATGSWTSTGGLTTARAGHTATLLPNGLVLVVGGTGAGASAELYHPASGTWTSSAPPSAARASHTATLLRDGRVLLAGGSDAGLPAGAAEIYDPVAESWTATAPLSTPRDRHTATLLANGKVLVAGGSSTAALNSVELFDPAAGTWSAAAALARHRLSHAAVLLSSGKVLVAGGSGPFISSCVMPIAGGAVVSGSLTTTDCRSVPRGSTYYADSYRFQGQAGDAISILMSSTDIDAYLYLLDSNNVVLQSDDQGGPTGNDARIPPISGTYALPATGEYTVEATSWGSNDTGSYTLTLTGPVTMPAVSMLPLGQTELFDPATGLWEAGPALSVARESHTLTLLPSGRVLATGGTGAGGALASAELYEPSGAAWVQTTSMNVGHLLPKAVLLPSGKVLVAGGGSSTSTCELFDPATASWAYTGSFTARVYHTLTLLANGKVLAAGGQGGACPAITSAQLYDPASGVWSATAPMAVARMNHTATLLADGRVLVAGGQTDCSTGAVSLASAAIYNPETEAWSSTPPMSSVRASHTATLLANGRVLVVGGRNEATDTDLSSAEIYDPFSGTWTPTAPLAISPRRSQSATLLPNGRVLVVGGSAVSGFGALPSVELYDPETGSWSEPPPMTESRHTHSATPLPDGTVLVAGGYDGSANSARASTLLYVPAVNAWKDGPPISYSGSGVQGQYGHAATLLPDGRVLVAGGANSWFSSAVAGLVDLGLNPASRRPVITSAPSALPGGLPFEVSGSGIRADSEASGGTTSSSAFGAPLVQLLSLESARSTWLRPDPRTNFWDEPMTLSFAAVPAGLDLGWHLLTVVRAGVASVSRSVEVQSCDVSISSGPANQVAAIGGTATFSVVAAGARTYQWQRNGVNIPGATTSSYTTPPVVGADSGTIYRVVIGGSCYSITSNPAVLTVADSSPPTARVVSPAGGEYWLLSPVEGPANTVYVTWSMSDDVRICRVEVSLWYSNDGGSIYVQAPAGGGLPASFGTGGTCPNPGEGTSSTVYTVPTTFPSGVSGSLYKIEVRVTDHAGNATTVRSTNPFYIVQSNPDSVRTLILKNTARMQAIEGVTPAQAAALELKLHELAANPKVLGFVVDLNGVTDVTDLLAVWDADSSNSDKANNVLFGCHGPDLSPPRPLPAGCTAVKDGVHDVLRSLLAIYTGVKHVVLVGDDRIIPLARMQDRTVLLSESAYPAGSVDITPNGTTVGQALAANKYLSDDPLAVLDAVRPDELSGSLFIPDLSVGRLVETPEEMITAISTFISQDGVLDLSVLDPTTGHKVLVTGYDFLTDSAKKARRRWKSALGVSTPDNSLEPVDGSLTEGTWGLGTVAERRTALRTHLGGNGGARYGVSSLSGHATHYEEGVPGTNPFDIQGLGSWDIYGADSCGTPSLGPLSLAGGFVYAVGCHGGLPVAGSCASDADHSLDLPQTFLSRGVVGYVANTGYGWGLRYGIGYGERLQELLSEELSKGGTVVTGEAVRKAKLRYFLETPRYDAYDEKSLMQWTFFGLPMYAVKTGIAPGGAAGMSFERPVEERPAVEPWGLLSVGRRMEAPAALPPYLVQLNLQFDLTAAGVYSKWSAGGDALPMTPGCSDSAGCYYTLNGLVERSSGAGDLPVQPYFIYDSRLSGTSQHGVLWKGGTYDEESGWIPVVGELQSNGGDGSNHGSSPRVGMINPTVPRAVPGQDPDQCRPSELEVNSLVVVAGEAVKDQEPDPSYTIERRYRGIDLEVFYFNDTATPSNNCDREGPVLGAGPYGGAYHQATGASIEWAVPSADASGVWRVLVVANDNSVDGQGRGVWVPVELVDDGNGTWRGSRTLAGASRVTYVVQAVDKRGNLTWLDYVAAQPPASGVPLGIPRTVDVPLDASPQADLSVDLIDAPDPVQGLGNLIYIISVANSGPSAASGVSVVQTLPAGVSFSSATGSGWSCSAGSGSVTCGRASLASGASAPLYVQVTTGPASATLNSSVTVSASESDPSAANNSASVQTTVNGVPHADLAMVKNDGGVTALWNRPLTYTLTVTNAGPSAVTGATVSDSFPAGLGAVSWTCTASAGSSCAATGTGNINDTSLALLSGGTATYTATGVVVFGTASPLVNAATVSSSTYDPVAANNSSTVNTPVDVDLVFKNGFEGPP